MGFLLPKIPLLLLLLISLNVFAEDEIVEDLGPNDGTIEIVYPPSPEVEYRNRRENWSILFGIGVDNILPNKFVSPLSGENYKDIYGSNNRVPLTQVSLGTKFNTELGSFGAEFLGGYGTLGGTDSLGNDRTLEITKYGGSVIFILDTMFAEPYVAPYVSGSGFILSYVDKSNNQITNTETSEAGTRKSGTTGIISALTAGALIQLNWIEKDTAYNARSSYGLNNAYLDVFASQYNSSSKSSDPQFQTSMNWGAGIRLEF